MSLKLFVHLSLLLCIHSYIYGTSVVDCPMVARLLNVGSKTLRKHLYIWCFIIFLLTHGTSFLLFLLYLNHFVLYIYCLVVTSHLYV